MTVHDLTPVRVRCRCGSAQVSPTPRGPAPSST